MEKLRTISSQIEKEEVGTLNFPGGDVLGSAKLRKERKNRLEMAVMYGNTAYYKVWINFADDEGLKTVHTTVWETNNDSIVLKGGVKIPLHRISEVKFP